jgi:hypothetical protein
MLENVVHGTARLVMIDRSGVRSLVRTIDAWKRMRQFSQLSTTSTMIGI